jgi:sterile alpha motif and leucine zipper-containing kinase AZK
MTPYIVSSAAFLDLIGGGRFGSVYRALWNGAEVAAKRIVCFEQEARMLSLIRHRNIIQFYGACTAAPNSCLVTEFASQGSLYHFLEGESPVFATRTCDWV